MAGPSTRIGITRPPRSRAAPTSRRTMSSGSSRRRPPSSPVAVSQCGPITASRTGEGLTARWSAVARTPVLAGGGQPVRAYHRQQDRAGTHRLVDHLREVDAELDGVDVHEDLVVTEAVGEPVVQPAGEGGGLLPPGAGEDATRRDRGHRHLLAHLRRLSCYK